MILDGLRKFICSIPCKPPGASMLLAVSDTHSSPADQEERRLVSLAQAEEHPPWI
jgi:hypothetical protein